MKMNILPVRPLLLSLALALAGCSDTPLREWRTTEKGGVFSLSISLDAEHVLVGAVQHGGSLWRTADGARLYDWNHKPDQVSALVATAFSAEGRFAATAERHQLALWDVASGRAIGTWAMEAPVLSIAVSGNGQRLLVGLQDNSALLIDTARDEPLARIRHGNGVQAVAITADGRIGITGADDGMLRAWDLDTGSTLLAHKFASGISTLALSADGSLLFVGRYHGKGMVWNLQRNQAVSAIGHDRTSIVSARFAPDGLTLLAGLPAGRIQEWNVSAGTLVRHWQADAPSAVRSSGLTTTAVAHDLRSRSIIAGFSDGSVRVWSR
ncbi:WD40 repeat domain-containing protein [Thauera mechernichensis]|uniref:WD40 repeat domain-containing protein n=1 Tax=Thauera mechernichensis TaxID=82788 RepID=A0ABW3WE24_9RHOO|nr:MULTISPECIES: hypothetical protein [Thauera]ENO81046.1 hypothetical protein B447_10178 [Thauera sp. 27]MDG3064007.1 hypothetical protein [Thauera mechernichensis]